MKTKRKGMNRRDLLRLGVASGGAVWLASHGLRPSRALGVDTMGGVGTFATIEVFPTSPLVLHPFTDPLLVPTPAVWKNISGSLVWDSTFGDPTPTTGGKQDSDGEVHQIGYNDPLFANSPMPKPKVFQVKLQVAEHSFTTSQVQTLVAYNTSPDGTGTIIPAGTIANLPNSTIYGFNGTFPGPMIYGVYGQPNLVRFENHLDENPNNLDRQDFGAPNWSFLTHLHNGHTASESDGNPFHKPGAYLPGEYSDNLYLNWPPDGDDREKQSFFWFHDHRMDHTGANVYKGMVGIYPLYDPQNDSGDERKGYGLPGVPTALLSNNDVDYSQQIKFDIPLVLYDCRLDDGATIHQDFHNTVAGTTHPEWWGKTFFRHFPNHGFVGDVFTVNGTAYPTVTVKRRRYRLRFLDASISRIYELKLMSSTGGPVAAVDTGRTGDKLQGQYQLPDGQQCMVFTEIATDGGVLPFPIVRDSFQVWPAKRREVIVDFSKYMDGTPTTKGDVIYLTDVLQMTTGRKPNEAMIAFDPETGKPLATPIPDLDFDPDFRVPLVKIVIDGTPGSRDPDKDRSVDPLVYTGGKASLKLASDGLPVLRMRALPPVPRSFNGVPMRHFTFARSGKFGGETQWLVNDLPFDSDAMNPGATPTRGSAELWTFQNGGGGWVHPVHIHMEEHQVITRNGVPAPDALHPDDRAREDVVALEPGEEVMFYRKFRTFLGRYVCHCHNLAHEDHAMMFGWTIVPP